MSRSKAKHADPKEQAGYTAVSNLILDDTRVSPGARLLYIQLKRYAWQKDHSFPGQELLAKNLGIGERTLRDYTSELRDAELIRTELRGQGRTLLYFLLEPPLPTKRDRQNPPLSTSGLDRQNPPTKTGKDRRSRAATSADLDRRSSTVLDRQGSPVLEENYSGKTPSGEGATASRRVFDDVEIKAVKQTAVTAFCDGAKAANRQRPTERDRQALGKAAGELFVEGRSADDLKWAAFEAGRLGRKCNALDGLIQDRRAGHTGGRAAVSRAAVGDFDESEYGWSNRRAQ